MRWTFRPSVKASTISGRPNYDVYIASDHPGGLTADKVSSGCRGFYQAVILTTDSLVRENPDGSFTSAFTPASFQTLAIYEATFGIRQVTWYTYPTPELGFNYPASASGDSISTQLTPAGTQVFPYLNWATRGLFIGDRHAYMRPQIDDVFIDDTQWLATTPCGTHVDLTGVQQRMTGADLTAVSTWQRLGYFPVKK